MWIRFYRCLILFSLLKKFSRKNGSKTPNLRFFEKNLYHYETIEDLHHKLLNIMLLITRKGWFYCFCNKYKGCELDYNQGWRLCRLCQIPVYLNNFEEYLDRAQFDLFKLKRFDFKLFPMLLECYVYDKQSLEAFSGRFHYSSRDRHTGSKNETSLQDQTKFTTDLKKRNREKKF